MLCRESGPERSVKFHGGLGLIPSPQPFLLATLVSAFVEPVLEVPNNPHASYPKLGHTAWTQGLTPQDGSPVGLPYKGSKFFNSFAKVWMGFFFKFFCICYCCQTNPTASKSKVMDLFAPSQKYTGELWLHYTFLQIAISRSTLARRLHWLIIRSMWFWLIMLDISN